MGTGGRAPPFLTSALDGCHFLAVTALPQEKEAPGTHRKGDCVEPRAGLDAVEKRKILLLSGI
jgi:hypothetical protein